MLIDNAVTLTNLATVYLNEPAYKCALAHILECFSLLMLGVDTLTSANVERVWGQDDVVHQNLGGLRGDLAIIRCQLISLACVANNAFHLWLNTSFKKKNIITPEALKYAHKASATSFYSSRTTPPPSMYTNPFLPARITFKNSNITLGNTASP